MEPIRFVYAIRDSIFEQLDRKSASGEAEDEDEDEGEEEATEGPLKTDAASKAENRRLVTTNRTKFLTWSFQSFHSSRIELRVIL